MNKKLFVPLAMLVCSTTTLFAGISAGIFAPSPKAPISGDYVEARSASVYCGACHYNSEILNGGREALMAWSFDSGVYHHVNIAGVKAMAAVAADQSLGLEESVRQTTLAVDTSASDAQVIAIKSLLAEKCGKDIGLITRVVRVPITFSHNSSTGYQVVGSGFGSLDITYRTDKGCCANPGMVWYSPLSPIEHRMVGFTESVQFTGSIDAPWQREAEDGAFYGPIAF